MIAERGLGVISDYMPPPISLAADYERIFEVVCKLGAQTEFAAVLREESCREVRNEHRSPIHHS